MATEQARTLVVGEYKSGKTELVNALLAAHVLPTDTLSATTVPTVVAFAPATSARLVRTGDTDREEIAVDPVSLGQHVTENGNAENAAGWTQAEVGISRKLLATGLVLVDTPGGVGAPGSLGTAAELPGAEAVLVVSDAGRELTASELALLRQADEAGPSVHLVLTRIDLHPHWRRVAELDRLHLRRAGLGHVPVLPVSASLRLHAAETGDQELDAETGMADLVSALTEGVAAAFGRRRARFVADELLAIGEQLALEVRTESAALADPRVALTMAREAEESRTKVHRLRDKASRWQQTLNDGVADLVSDVEFDLRDRLRAVAADAEEAIDETDPAKTWDQYAPWLQERVADATSTNVVWAEERTRWLAERVGSLFAEDGKGVLPELDLGEHVGTTDAVTLLAAPDHEKFGFSQSLLVGMRGSYGGILMIGMATTIAGLALLNPFSLGAGALLGGKTLYDERKRARRRRQAEAKQAVRRHIDDVVFRVGKNTRDMLRDVQRTLRDHFTTTAKELDGSLAAQIQAASTAIALHTDELARERRSREVRAELATLEALTQRSTALRAAVTDEARHAVSLRSIVPADPTSVPDPDEPPAAPPIDLGTHARPRTLAATS